MFSWIKNFFNSQAKKNPKENPAIKQEDMTAEESAAEVEKEDRPNADAIEATDTAKKAGGKYAIRKAKDGTWMFNMVSANSLIFATSQTYTTMGACKKGIASVGSSAPAAPIEDQTQTLFDRLPNPKFELYIDQGGKFRFRLRAVNGNVILASQGYTAKANCKKGIDAVRANCQSAAIVNEETDTPSDR